MSLKRLNFWENFAAKVIKLFFLRQWRSDKINLKNFKLSLNMARLGTFTWSGAFSSAPFVQALVLNGKRKGQRDQHFSLPRRRVIGKDKSFVKQTPCLNSYFNWIYFVVLSLKTLNLKKCYLRETAFVYNQVLYLNKFLISARKREIILILNDSRKCIFTAHKKAKKLY